MIAVLIVAGGSGSRFAKTDLPKQFYKIDGEFILSKTLKAFSGADFVCVVIRKEDEVFFKKNFPEIAFTYGGENRQVSVHNGLKFIATKVNPKFVLIADAARPFSSKDLILRVTQALKEGELAVIPGIKLQDTIKKAPLGYVSETLNREELFAAQTPQGFDFKMILSLHDEFAGLNFTDDSSLCEKKGIKVRVVQGEKDNVKITTIEDLR